MAVNHWPRAIETHFINHPDTEHVCGTSRSSITRSCRTTTCSSRPRHASGTRERAAGEGPHDATGATVWCVIDALEAKRPAQFVVENVPEFRGGSCFAWLGALSVLGYSTEEHVLNAAEWGVPAGAREARHHGPLRSRGGEAQDAEHPACQLETSSTGNAVSGDRPRAGPRELQAASQTDEPASALASSSRTSATRRRPAASTAPSEPSRRRTATPSSMETECGWCPSTRPRPPCRSLRRTSPFGQPRRADEATRQCRAARPGSRSHRAASRCRMSAKWMRVETDFVDHPRRSASPPSSTSRWRGVCPAGVDVSCPVSVPRDTCGTSTGQPSKPRAGGADRPAHSSKRS